MTQFHVVSNILLFSLSVICYIMVLETLYYNLYNIKTNIIAY